MKFVGVSEISSSSTPLCGRKTSFSIHVYYSNIEQTSPDLLAAVFFCCLEALHLFYFIFKFHNVNGHWSHDIYNSADWLLKA